jgi:hypothetical protein
LPLEIFSCPTSVLLLPLLPLYLLAPLLHCFARPLFCFQVYFNPFFLSVRVSVFVFSAILVPPPQGSQRLPQHLADLLPIALHTIDHCCLHILCTAPSAPVNSTETGTQAQ